MDKFGSRLEYMQTKFTRLMQSFPPRAQVVPDQDPCWVYNTTGDILSRDQFTICLLAGLHKVS